MLLALVAVALGAMAQASSGLGFALVAGPLLIAAVGAADGVPLLILLSALLNVVILIREHRAIRYAAGALVLIPAVIAVPAINPLVERLEARTAAIAAGVLTVAAATALLLGLRVRALRGKVGAAIAGVVSTTMNSIAGIGGPPVALYAANADWSVAGARATMQAVFLVSNVALIVVKRVPPFSPWLLVAVAVGYLLGVVAARWMSDELAKRLTLLLAAAGGAALVIRSSVS